MTNHCQEECEITGTGPEIRETNDQKKITYETNRTSQPSRRLVAQGNVGARAFESGQKPGQSMVCPLDAPSIVQAAGSAHRPGIIRPRKSGAISQNSTD